METLVREWARAYGTVHVISGPVLDSDCNGHRDNDEDYPKYAGGMFYCTHVYITNYCNSSNALIRAQ